MIIDFSIENFRSIKDKQTMSFAAYRKIDDTLEPVVEKYENTPGINGGILKGAVIYGANASGKSNLLKGIKYFRDFICHSYERYNSGEKLSAQSFCLDEESSKKPWRFELNFIVKGVRYEYKIAISTDRVEEESLEAYPKGKPQKWFVRTWNAEFKEYSWSPSRSDYYNSRSISDLRENCSYISHASKKIQSSEKDNQDFEDVRSFLRNRILILDTNTISDAFSQFSSREILENSIFATEIKSFLKNADIGISDIIVKEEDDSWMHGLDLNNPAMKELVEKERIKETFIHIGENGKEYPIKFADESAGTQTLFRSIGLLIIALTAGCTVLFDELETSLHPLLVLKIMDLFYRKGNGNMRDVQLIFTAHNPTFLGSDVLRRDQIWFVGKTDDGRSELYSLTEFKTRKSMDVAKSYLSGLFGGVPAFGELFSNVCREEPNEPGDVKD